MRYDSCQFGSFDGLDNRRELMVLLQRLGEHLPEPMARERRARWLESLIPLSVSGMAKAPMKVTPCDPVVAYQLLLQITGVLGVPINTAAKRLEEAVKRQ